VCDTKEKCGKNKYINTTSQIKIIKTISILRFYILKS